MKTLFNFITGTLLTAIVYFLGGWDMAIQVLVVMMILDYITGILKAIFNKEINSYVGVKGIIKKVGYLIIVGVSVMLDRLMGDTGAVRNVVIYFFVANEGISIVENWVAMGLPMPQVIIDTLEQIKQKGDQK